MKHILVTPIKDLDGNVVTIQVSEDRKVPLTIPYALSALVNRWVGQLNAQNCTMQDSLMALRLKDQVREWEKIEVKEGEPNVFSLEDADYEYWEEIVEVGAPRLFVLYAINVKRAFADLKK